ncbi:unnamed protein product [Miscanthus lutarioriparius]|uniref:GDSL esterase/lipase n=1 Tax=Miscanthus lutarioriparius TaxID=422564 RepID=A0A811MUC3_9POAL|nr:unnamed protein product [Miscanthus lutarioriparius]
MPPNFIFGDSLVDAGNNNYIVSLSKANYPPNGIDFFGHQPTGRYTNGRTIIDILGQEMGLGGFVPPYMAPETTGDAVMRGVNYASGGGGILNQTGSIFGGRLNLDAQIDNYANSRHDLIARHGEVEAASLLRGALFSVTMGSNDFINNYLTPIFSVPQRVTTPPVAFISAMIAKYRQQLTRLYLLDARKIVVVNVGPIGCIPYQRETNPSAGMACAEFPNQLTQAFNRRLRDPELGRRRPPRLALRLRRRLSHLLRHHRQLQIPRVRGSGLGVLLRGRAVRRAGAVRADVAVLRGQVQVRVLGPDHPSEAANALIARRILDGSPVNVRQLIVT